MLDQIPFSPSAKEAEMWFPWQLNNQIAQFSIGARALVPSRLRLLSPHPSGRSSINAPWCIFHQKGNQMKRMIALCLACAGTFALEAARAESLVYAIAINEAEDEGIKEEIKDAKDKASEAKAERDALVQEYAKLKEEFDLRKARYNSAIDTFNQRCAGRPVTTPGCDSLSNAAEAAEAQAEALTPRASQLGAKIQAASNQAVLADARVQKLTNYETQLRAANSRMRARLAGQCSSVSPYSRLEELKLKCGNVQFDGASSELRECTTQRCLQYESLNK